MKYLVTDVGIYCDEIVYIEHYSANSIDEIEEYEKLLGVDDIKYIELENTLPPLPKEKLFNCFTYYNNKVIFGEKLILDSEYHKRLEELNRINFLSQDIESFIRPMYNNPDFFTIPSNHLVYKKEYQKQIKQKINKIKKFIDDNFTYYERLHGYIKRKKK